MPIPAHVLQVRDALSKDRRAERFLGAHEVRWAAIAWLQGDAHQPVNGFVFRLETERTPKTVHDAPRWRYVLRWAPASADGWGWSELINVEATGG